jgi:hypothetical protein
MDTADAAGIGDPFADHGGGDGAGLASDRSSQSFAVEYNSEPVANNVEEQPYTSAPEQEEKYEDEIYESDQPVAESEAVRDSKAIVPSMRNSKPMSRGPADAAPVHSNDGNSIATIHASYIVHIRTLQKTNAALGKKIDFLNAMQNDSTKMKLVKKLQRILKEKQIMIDNLADMIVSRSVMTTEALSAHLEQIIEAGAMDQVNPAKTKKELVDARKENIRLLSELRDSKRHIRQLEAMTTDKKEGSGSRPSTARTRESTSPARPAVSATTAQADAERQQKYDALSREFLELSTAHTSLQEAHHTLTLSLVEHRKLIDTITAENRGLRGHLQQWETSEEKRILAEQMCLSLQDEKEKWVQNQENVYQELRALKVRLQSLAVAKNEEKVESDKKVQSARGEVKEAREHSSVLERQLNLLKADLKVSAEMLAFERQQHERTQLLVESPPNERRNEAKEKQAIAEKQVKALEFELDALKKKYAIAITPGSTNTTAHTSILSENTRLLCLISSMESQLGAALVSADSAQDKIDEAVSGRKSAEGELGVLQLAMHQMASDLQTLQRNSTEREKLSNQLMTVKIPKLRSQRKELAANVQRLNVTVLEMSKEVDREKKRAAQLEEELRFGVAVPPREQLTRKDSTPQPQPSSGEKGLTPRERRDVRERQKHLEAEKAKPTLVEKVKSALGIGEEETQEEQALPPESAIKPVSKAAVESAATVPTSDTALDEDQWYDPSGTWSRYPTEDGEAWFFYHNFTQESVWIDPLLDEATGISSALAGAAATVAMAAASATVVPTAAAGTTSFHHHTESGLDISSYRLGEMQFDELSGVESSRSLKPSVNASSMLPPGSTRSIASSNLDLTPLASERLPELTERPLTSRTAVAAAATKDADYTLDDDFPEETPPPKTTVSVASVASTYAAPAAPIEDDFPEEDLEEF